MAGGCVGGHLVVVLFGVFSEDVQEAFEDIKGSRRIRMFIYIFLALRQHGHSDYSFVYARRCSAVFN